MSADACAVSGRPPPASGNEYSSAKAPLDPTFYDVDVEFLSILTGIKDPEQLKQHVIKVQADAYAVRTFLPLSKTRKSQGNADQMCVIATQVYPYPCIRMFAIAKYVHEPSLLDTGLCFTQC